MAPAERRAEERPPHEGAARARPAIGKVGRGVRTGRCGGRPPPAVVHGLEEFNRGEFFQQHETLEAAWIVESDPVRYLYQGILQVGVGLYHLGRGNLYGAERLMARGLALLPPFLPDCMGIDVERFVQESERCLAAVRALTPATAAAFDRTLLPCVSYRLPYGDEAEAESAGGG